MSLVAAKISYVVESIVKFIQLFSLPSLNRGENGVAQNEDEENNEGDKKKSRLPKKRFLFTDEIR
ncbi:hypothetical protein E2C01_075388 [Portunus trituberculatus]|uniref:Uncharacterized protein n=1 Tax=Portunus trituberculatus TaxID=210409 RepID=A0A5B7IEY8_PORTR|nr:hypothetical protein [Portunus trituberculatus]